MTNGTVRTNFSTRIRGWALHSDYLWGPMESTLLEPNTCTSPVIQSPPAASVQEGNGYSRMLIFDRVFGTTRMAYLLFRIGLRAIAAYRSAPGMRRTTSCHSFGCVRRSP